MTRFIRVQDGCSTAEHAVPPSEWTWVGADPPGPEEVWTRCASVVERYAWRDKWGHVVECRMSLECPHGIVFYCDGTELAARELHERLRVQAAVARAETLVIRFHNEYDDIYDEDGEEVVKSIPAHVHMDCPICAHADMGTDCYGETHQDAHEGGSAITCDCGARFVPVGEDSRGLLWKFVEQRPRTGRFTYKIRAL